LSRKVVRKVIRSGETSFSYERTVQPRPKLGQWTAALDELLEANAAKPAREQLTLIRLFEELRGRGYGGGYDAVRRYARRWSKERGQSTAAAYVPLSFAPGKPSSSTHMGTSRSRAFVAVGAVLSATCFDWNVWF
jgi:transposase